MLKGSFVEYSIVMSIVMRIREKIKILSKYIFLTYREPAVAHQLINARLTHEGPLSRCDVTLYRAFCRLPASERTFVYYTFAGA